MLDFRHEMLDLRFKSKSMEWKAQKLISKYTIPKRENFKPIL